MKPIIKKIITYLLGASSIGTASVVVYEYGALEFFNYYYKTENESFESERSEALNEKNDSHGDTLTWTPIEEEEEEELRSSEMKKEATGGYPRISTKKPDGVRVGCICMDNDRQDNKGTGACNGHGGVRFWLYQQGDGRVYEYPTKRHKEHPSPLAAEELSNLTYYNHKRHEYKSKKDSSDSFFYMILGIFICITIAYIARLWWQEASKNELSD